MKKISLHLPSSAFVGRGHMIWKHEDLLRRWSEPSSPARIWCFCWRRNSEMELVLGKSGLSCRLEWLMSRWTNDAVPCQGCSPEIICNGQWSKTLSNYWLVMLNPIRFSYPLLEIPEDSLIHLSHQGFPAYNAGDPGLIPGSGRSPGEGNGNPLQHSCL